MLQLDRLLRSCTDSFGTSARYAIQFFVNLWNTLVGFVVDVIGFGHTVANISQLIPNPTAAGIVFWVLLILISVIAIGIVFLTIYSLIITYVRYMKANQFDR